MLELAPDQIQRLDAVGALVDQRDPRVAHELGDPALLDVPRAAVHLQRARCDLEAEVGAPGLDQRDQQLQGAPRPRRAPRHRARDWRDRARRRPCRSSARIASIWVFMVISMRRTSGCSMIRAGRSAPPVAAPPLDPLPGVGERGLIGALGDRQALEADLEAGVVHHGEHRAHAALLLADQVADRAVVVPERHDAGGAGVDAELVLQRDAAHVVARPERAVGLDQELRDQEQRDAARAGRRVRRARQHHVDDVRRCSRARRR